MSDKEELEKIAEKYKKRNQYINQWQKDKYYRLTVLIPKEQKETITGTAKEKGFNTVSDYIKSLIDKDLNTAAAPDVVTDHEQIKPLVLECPEIESDYDVLDTYRPIRTPEELQKPTETLEERLERLKKEFGTPEE